MIHEDSDCCGNKKTHTCDTDDFCSKNTLSMMDGVPENISYECRDSRFIKCWLTEEYEKRMTIIREQVSKFSAQYERTETSMKYFTSHDVSHSRTVESILYKLIPGTKFALLSEHERFYLIAGAWLHDIGMYTEGIASEVFSADELRGNHHVYSQKMISENYPLLGIEEHEVSIFTQIAHFHRQKEDIETCREIITCNGITIRLRLLCAYLRLADALHVDQSRTKDKEYAIALTYNMPHASKMHWIRSKLVLGIDINPALSKITVHLKYPLNINEQFSGNPNNKEKMDDFDKKLNKIYRMFILNPLKREVDSLKKVLIENKITTFINIDEEVQHIYFNRKFLKEISSIADAEMGMRKPSSTTMVSGILETVINIIVEHNAAKAIITNDDTKEKERNLIKRAQTQITNFTNRMLEMLCKEKPCHFMARTLLDNIESIISKPNECGTKKKELATEIKKRLKIYRTTAARAHVQQTGDVLFRRIEESLQKGEENSIKFLGSYLELYRNMSYYDSTLIRVQACSYMEEMLTHRRKKTFAYWQVNKIIEEAYLEIVNNDSFNKYTTFSTIEPCPNTKEKERFSCIRSPTPPSGGSSKSSFQHLPPCSDTAYTTVSEEIPAILGILVYGYSTTVIESLCGFRDAIINKLLRLLIHYSVISKKGKTPFLTTDPVVSLLSDSRGKNRLEEIVSKYIQVFVCEGQPKNIQEDGEVRYHDGYEYEQALHERNFSNTVIVADSVSATLISQYYAVKQTASLSSYTAIHGYYKANVPDMCLGSPQVMGTSRQRAIPPLDQYKECIPFPRINYFMLGANGFSKKYIYHSAGHLSHISNALMKARTNVLLVMQSSKYLADPSYEKDFSGGRCIPFTKGAVIKKSGKMQCYKSYEEEKVRDTYFGISKEQYFNMMHTGTGRNTSPLVVYTPTEESIRFNEIDTIISEFKTIDIETLVYEKGQRLYLHGPKMLIDRRLANRNINTDSSINNGIFPRVFSEIGETIFSEMRTVQPPEEPKPTTGNKQSEHNRCRASKRKNTRKRPMTIKNRRTRSAN